MDSAAHDSATRGPCSRVPACSLLVFLLGVALLASCGPSSRPELAEWRSLWAAERAGMPTERDLEGPNALEMCQRLLAASRTARQHLLPSPDEALDRAVEGWVEGAGSLGYDCPGAKGDAAAVRSAMQELDELAAQVDAALGVMGNARGSRPPDAPA